MKHPTFALRRLLTNVGLPMLGILALTLSSPSVSLAGDWMFAQSEFSHNPVTGQRLTQYASVAPVEGLPDPRDVTSRYWSTRTRLRGADGSSDTIYEVRSFGDARGGDDARWERGFDAWKDAANIAGPFWAGAYWPGGTPAPGLDYQNQGYGTGYGTPYGFGGYGGGGGPYAGYGPNGYFGGGGVPFGVSPYGYGHPPYSAPGYGGPGHRPPGHRPPGHRPPGHRPPGHGQPPGHGGGGNGGHHGGGGGNGGGGHGGGAG